MIPPDGSASVDRVCADIHGHNEIGFEVEHRAEVAFNLHRMNRPVRRQADPHAVEALVPGKQ